MKYKMIVLDESIITLFTYFKLDSNWFENFEIPSKNSAKIKRVVISDTIYLLSEQANVESKLLLINTSNNGLFDGVENKKKVAVFNRILVLALYKFGHSVTPPTAWRKYYGDNFISIGSGFKEGGFETRLLFQKNPPEPDNAYMFDHIKNDNKQEEDYTIDEDAFIEACLNYEDALARAPESVIAEEDHNFGIELTQSISGYYGQHHSIQHWYDNILTKEQRIFVDKGYDTPVRLKGAAGTGKTLALAAKIIKNAYDFEKKNCKKNLVFITHSSVNSQSVLDIIHSMDNLNLYSNFKNVKLKVISLYDLAQDLLNYNLKDLTPLSTDGREGRQLQFELFESILNLALKDISFVKGMLGKCSKRFQDIVLSSDERRRFILQTLNEFACILDAENIYAGSSTADKYLNGAREAWLMELESSNERKVILYLHEQYKRDLKSMNVLSMDQMIADFNRYLLSHEWNHIRDTNGYDAVFVDELHCFTKPERMIFHELFKGSSRKSTDKLPLFMAYDINQATDDRFIYSISPNNAASLVKSTKVGGTDLIELTKVFRYTPSITKFLKHIDGSVPALDLASEWCTSKKLNNENIDGDTPELRVFSKNMDLVDEIFKEADTLAAKSPQKSVAVLCVNPELFDHYSKSLGRIRGKFLRLASRDDIIKTQRGRSKCIFSMPDYVAGLQFDTVYLIHLDRNELDEDNPHSGEYRRFISQVYLGSSRAIKKLVIASSLERRGPVHLLNGAIEEGSLIRKN